MAASPIRVLVADGQRMFADGVRLLLGAEEGIRVVGAASTLDDALRMPRGGPPDVVLADPDLPGEEDAVPALARAYPDARMLVVAPSGDADVAVRALASGARGVVPRTESLEGLADVVRQAAAGELVVPADDLADVLGRLREALAERELGESALASLTGRETEILRSLAAGESTTGVAVTLGISRLTVQSHVKSILAKLGVHSKLEAVTIAWRYGLADSSRSA